MDVLAPPGRRENGVRSEHPGKALLQGGIDEGACRTRLLVKKEGEKYLTPANQSKSSERKMKTRRVTRWIQGGLIFLLLTAFLLSSKTSLGMPSGQARGKAYAGIYSEAEIRKIMAVLDNKIEGGKSTAKAKDKLMNLGDLQTRLIVSLSEIVIQRDPAPAADIAFLLLTVLIIFS